VGKESDIAKDALKMLYCPYCIMENICFSKSCKYPCSFTYILVEAPTVSMENELKDVL